MHLSNISRVIRNAGLGGIVFPVGTVIPYSGATPSISGWQQWTPAFDRNLFSSVTASPGTTVTQSGGPSVSVSLSSAGAHSSIGNAISDTGRNDTGANGFFGQFSPSFGAHSHPVITQSFTLSPTRAQFNFLVATTEHATIPVNSLIFSSRINSSLGNLFSSTLNTYISGSSTGTGNIITGTNSQTAIFNSTSAGSHRHGGIFAFFDGSGSFSGVAKSTLFAGAHSHQASLSYQQTVFGDTVFLRLYAVLAELEPSDDIIVGYIGDLDKIRPPWYLCNGQNGTVDLTDKFIAVNNNRAPGENQSPDLSRSALSVDFTDTSHSHEPATGINRGDIGHFYPHSIGQWTHSHPINASYNDSPVIPARVNLRFIQYKDNPDAASFSITPRTTAVNEGSSVTFTVITANVTNGTILYWSTESISGTVDASDFTDNQTTGSFTINNNTATIVRGITADAVTEGTESFSLQIRTGSVSGNIVAVSDIVTINDTSVNPPLVALAWGAGIGGRLGTNDTIDRSSPVSVVGGIIDWIKISTGNNHNLAIRSNGTLWAWGFNGQGRLGTGNTVSSVSPVLVVGGFTDWIQVTASPSNGLALRSNGTIWAWGRGSEGQLGDNTSFVDRSSPVSVVGGITDWTEISVNGNHSLALRSNGTLWAWGAGSSGQLGTNDTANRSSPVTVVGGITDWEQISAGSAHNLALRSNGSLWAWGNGFSGQLGNGSSGNAGRRLSPTSVVGGITDWIKISAGNDHSLALRSNGTVWAWGRAAEGQLGTNDTISRLSPVSVVGGVTDWTEIAAGYSHNLAIRSNGTLWAWGSNDGRLGDNTTINRSSPVSVVGGITNWTQISGGFHSLALRQVLPYSVTSNTISVDEGSSVTFTVTTPGVPNGTILYWSTESISGTVNASDFTDNQTTGSFTINNNTATIVRGITADAVTEGTESFSLQVRTGSVSGNIVAVSDIVTINDTSQNPTYAVTPNVTSVNEGSSVTFTVTTTDVANGTILYWSTESISGTVNASDFTDNAVSGSFTINNNTATIVRGIRADFTTEGTEQFRLLIRTGSTSGTVVATSSTVTINDTSQDPTYAVTPNVTSVNEGSSVAFTITTTNVSNGTVLFWSTDPVSGTVDASDFTDSTTTGSLTINNNISTIIRTLRNDATIEGTESFRLLIRTGSVSGVVVATSSIVTINDTSQPASMLSWGVNISGRLGDNTTIDRLTPVQVAGGFNTSVVSAGGNHSLAIRSNGTLWAWGFNNLGQLGDNTTISRLSPIQVVDTSSGWTQVATGLNHSLAIRNGTVWAWGSGSSGRLGTNNTDHRSSPVSVVGGFTDWIQISAGDSHSLALRSNGTLWAWGFGSSGRLGDNSTEWRSSPVSVAGGFTNWTHIAAGNNHNLAIRSNGTLWAWGSNFYAQLGTNNTVTRSSPVQVAGGFTDWTHIAAGGREFSAHSLAIRSNGTLWAWGHNPQGQLGTNDLISRSSPVSVVGGFTDWIQVTAGGNHSVALRSNGTLWAWGAGSYGRLGNGSEATRQSPVQVAGGITNWTQISAGQSHTIALRST